MNIRHFAVLIVAASLFSLLVVIRPHQTPTDADFSRPVEAAVENFVLPAYRKLADAALVQRSGMEALCAEPDSGKLEAARSAFVVLVEAFSGIEMFRFGPAQTDHRFERLFFWPDNRGRGLRQVQELLAEQDQFALNIEGLWGKSVAVQGLLALEYTLYGQGSDALGVEAGYRCAYGRSISDAVARNAKAILEDWTSPNGYGELMRNPGQDNPIYRSHGESLQAMFKAAAGMLETVSRIKIGASIGDGPDTAKPKRAPFWRSGLTLATMRANIDAVESLNEALRLEGVLPARWAGEVRQLRWELEQAKGLIAEVEAISGDYLVAAADADSNETLLFLTLTVDAATRILDTRYPAALGLVIGFNALDGD